MIITCCFLPGRRKVSDKIFRQNRNTGCSNTWFKKMGFERVNYENIAQPDRSHKIEHNTKPKNV